MLTIRLTRVGKKNSPAYRVVVADKKRAVKRKFIEILGHYNPTLTPKTLKIDKDRALFWMNTGAQPSETVRNLMCDLGILNKKEKVNKVYGKKFTKKALKEGADKKPEIKEEVKSEEVTTEQTEPETAKAEESKQEVAEEIKETVDESKEKEESPEKAKEETND